MTLRDEPFFFESHGRRLFGIWQPADGGPKAAVLYCHPFGEEKKSAHRAFVEAARALAGEGVASLRFDMSGCGDSEGVFQEASVAQWLEDIESAWAELARRASGAPRVLLGLRMGGSLAAMAQGRLPDVHALILWQPLLSGKTEFDQELRRLLIQQMMVQGKAEKQGDFMAAFQRGERELELDGYVISPAMYREIGAINLDALRSKLPARRALVQFGRSIARLDAFANPDPAIPNLVLDLPPVWARTDFIPSPGTGQLLAREGVMRWIA